MTELPSTPPPLPKRDQGAALQPGFLRAWRGVWLFTWRSQFTLRRLPGLLVTLLAIPLLTLFTLEPLKLLTAHYDWREQPRRRVAEFRAKLVSADGKLEREVARKLTQIITDEQRDIELPFSAAGSDEAMRFSDEALDQQIEQARACHERIARRARLLLDDKQFALFHQLQERKLEEAIETIRRFDLQSLRPFYRWLIDFYLLLALPLYCLSACGSMIRDELQSETLSFLTTRPVSRARLFLIKYLCQMTWLQTLAAVHALLLFGVGFARDVSGVGSVMALFLGAQALGVLAWGALSALLGLISRRYIVLGIVYGFIVEIGIGRIPTNINSLSLTRHLQSLLEQNPLLSRLYEWPPQSGWFSVAMLLLAAMLFLSAGAALFTFHEYHHATETQK